MFLCLIIYTLECWHLGKSIFVFAQAIETKSAGVHWQQETRKYVFGKLYHKLKREGTYVHTWYIDGIERIRR